MSIHRSQSRTGRGASILLAVLTLMAASAFSQVQPGGSHSIVGSRLDLGPEDSSKRVTVTVWLHQHNKDAFDALVQQMYQKGSPQYHHWLTMAQYKATFAPTQKDAALVRDFLSGHNLTVSSTEKNNHYVTASGRISDVQDAFNVQINRFNVKGTIHQAATSEPSVAGPARAVVAAVQVSDLTYSSNAAAAKDLDTGVPFRGVELTPGVNPNGLFFSANCFRSPETKYSPRGAADPSQSISATAMALISPPPLPTCRLAVMMQLSCKLPTG